MNANELADWIKNTEFYNNSDPNINDKMDEVEAMLRQQQAEIEALKITIAKITINSNLTDEEILIEAKYQPNLGYYLACEYDVLDFARAILKKASEK